VTTKLDRERVQKDLELSRRLILDMDKEKGITNTVFTSSDEFKEYNEL